MILRKEERVLTFRKEEFTVLYHFYECTDSGEQFTSTALDTTTMNQLYNQYREKHHLPFPDEIRAIREQYGLSTIKMADVLGFGINVYRHYENGEVPSESNGRLIQLARDPKRFRELVLLSDAYNAQEQSRVLKKIDRIIEEQEQLDFDYKFEAYLLGSPLPDVFSGYRRPNLKRLTQMVVFFAERLQPWKTGLNKLLFYADFLHFRKTGFSISGTRYCAIDMGPVPNNFNSIFELLVNREQITIQREEFGDGRLGEQFRAHTGYTFTSDLFTEDELATLRAVEARFRGVSTREIVDISHREKAWEENFTAGKRMISYRYGFELEGV